MLEALNYCTPPGQRKKEVKQKQVASRQQDNGWFGAIRNFYMPPPIIKVAKRKGREAPRMPKIPNYALKKMVYFKILIFFKFVSCKNIFLKYSSHY